MEDDLQSIIEKQEPITLEYARVPKKSNLKKYFLIGGVVATTLAVAYGGCYLYELYTTFQALKNVSGIGGL